MNYGKIADIKFTEPGKDGIIDVKVTFEDDKTFFYGVIYHVEDRDTYVYQANDYRYRLDEFLLTKVLQKIKELNQKENKYV